MEIFEPYPGTYRYQILPSFCRFILENHLQGFSEAQIEIGLQVRIPVMATLTARFSKEEVLQLTVESSRLFLNFLAENKAADQIRFAMERWLKDQLGVTGKFEIQARDITLVSYARGYGLKRFIPVFTQDLQEGLKIISEIDSFLLGSVTSATDTYIGILKDRIEEETNLSKKLIQASPAITFVYDLVENKEIFISGKVDEVLGYTADELIAMGENVLAQLTHPDDVAVLADHFSKLNEGGKESTWMLEYRFRTRDGTYKWLRTYDVVFKKDPDGKPREVLGKTFEITAEKEIALALEKRERQLLEAQSLAHIGSYEWNIKDNHSTNSQEVFRIFEMNEDQKYEEFLTYVHPDDQQKVKAALDLAFSTGHYECEYRYRRKGSEKVIWSIGKVEFQEGEAVRMVGTVQDITEIKRMEKELIEKTKELQQSNDNLQQFAFVASHDLKEPLRKISMLTNMIELEEKEKLSGRALVNLQKVQASARAMTRMIEDILAFSVMEAGEKKQKTSLQSIALQVTELLDESIREKAAEVQFKDLPDACVVPSQFNQLFQNLIVNSLKFSRKGVPPKISIEARWIDEGTSRKLQLTFSDNGIGFSPEMGEKIFELFKRLHSRSEYEGSGLGLAITRKIVENHHGTIRAYSREGEGASFEIVIPQ